MFGLANPELVANLTQEAWEKTYMLLGNGTTSAGNVAVDMASYVKPDDIWKCSLEDDLNNVRYGIILLFNDGPFMTPYNPEQISYFGMISGITNRK